MDQDKKIFHGDMTFTEWAAQQDQTNLEYNAIERGHRSYPGYTLEDIKKDIFTNYIINEDNQKVIQENFGTRHINSKKLNEQLSKLNRIIFTGSLGEFKSVDKRGHGDTVSAKLGGRGKSAETVAFRIEEKAVRYAHYLIEHNMAGSAQTISDLVRMGFVKYLEMIPVINELIDAISTRFTLDIKMERAHLDRMTVDDMLKGFDLSIETQEKDLADAIRHIENKEELEEIRDWTTMFIKDALTYNCATKKEKARVKEFIMGNSKLYNIMTMLEREKLLTREYIDDVRTKGIVPPNFDIFTQEDTKFNR
jgi:hypothetical protein